LRIDCARTPRLDIHCDDRLGSRLGLASLLLCVLGQTLLPDLGGLGVLLLVIRTEEVDLVIVVLSSLLLLLGSLGRVEGQLAGLWAVGGVLLAWVTRELRELGLKRGDVLVPAVGVRVLLNGRRALESLEGLDIGLRRGVAEAGVSDCC